MKNLGDLQRLMKTAQEMQERLQKELAEMRVEGTSGGGMVSVTLDGRKGLAAIRLEKDVVDPADVGMLQDLILAAFADASAKVDEAVSKKMGGLAGGLKIPGLG